MNLEDSELHNFVSILLIKRLLLSKYSGLIFCAYIASFMSKIVQNIKKGVYFSMSNLVLEKKDLFGRYKKMNIETKGIG